MLSWSANETGRTIDLGGIVDLSIDIGLVGGGDLAAIGRSIGAAQPDPARVAAVAATVSAEAGFKAATVAGAFEILNRIVDATGLPVGKRGRESLGWIISDLGLDAFPHARHDAAQDLA